MAMLGKGCWHTAMLFTVGWYLITAPTAADLDSTCPSLLRGPSGLAISDIVIGTLTLREPGRVNARRCDIASRQVEIDAPLSRWIELDQFESLAACQAALEGREAKTLEENASYRPIAEVQLHDEGIAAPSETDVDLRVSALSAAAKLQIYASRCVASDDPRLAK